MSGCVGTGDGLRKSAAPSPPTARHVRAMPVPAAETPQPAPARDFHDADKVMVHGQKTSGIGASTADAKWSVGLGMMMSPSKPRNQAMSGRNPAWESLAEREQKWTAFQHDPEWQKARIQTETDAGGSLTEKITNYILAPTSYSPMK